MMRARDWSHGHSIGTGVLGGILLSGHVWLVFVLGISAGIALAYARQTATWLAGAWREHAKNRRGGRKRAPVAPVLKAVYRTAQNRDGIPY